MDLKQLSDCSHSASDKYTESGMKESVFHKKIVLKSHVVSPNRVEKLILFYHGTRLAVATS